MIGKTKYGTASEALLLLEASCCEGISLPESWPTPAVAHLFGRAVRYHRGADLSFAAGIASGGLRAAAFLDAGALSDQLGRLRELARCHIPALIICRADAASRLSVAALRDSGCIVLCAASAPNAVYLALAGHRAAEHALAPAVLLVSDDGSKHDIALPESQRIIELLGDPDDAVAAPTPAQELVFGKNRRRIPNWFHADHPTLTGAGKSGSMATLEQAAQDRYFDHYLSEIVGQAFEACPETGGMLHEIRAKDAEYLVLTAGPASQHAAAAADRLRERTGAAHLALLHPLPAAALTRLLSGKKAATWLEPFEATLPADTWRQRAAELGKHAPKLYRGMLTGPASPETLELVFQNMLPKGAHRTDFFLDVEFTRDGSEFPQHEILLQTLKRRFPDAGSWSISGTATAQAAQTPAAAVPLTLRRQKDLGPMYTRATRFFHDVAVPFSAGEAVADPFQALPAAPAGAAGLAGSPAGRTQLPVFKPEWCTGCGDCLVQCPQAALPPLVLNVEALLRGAMEASGKRGMPLSQLTPMLKNLGKIAGQVVLEAAAPVRAVADFLPEAFSRLAAQMKLEGDKLEKARREVDAITELLAPLPLAAPDTFFGQAERRDKGSGELFALALDTQACTGCGICAAVCAPAALEMSADTPEVQSRAAAALELWEQLPDTAPATVQRQYQDERYDPFAAILLSRYNYRTLAGPSDDASAPRKALLHRITALAEAILQPPLAAQCREIEQMIGALSDNIRTLLGEALPPDNSPALIEAIAGAQGQKLPLDEIIAKLSAQQHLKLVDTAALQRKIELENALKDLLWLLKEGPTGMGRARYGLFFPGRQTADTYPFHPYLVPAFAAPGGSIDQALGLFEAGLRHTIDNIRLLRRAKLEVKNQYRHEVHAPAIAALDWDQLDEGEKALAAPLLLLCERKHLPDHFLERLPALLARRYPLKVIVLDDGVFSPDTAPEAYFHFRHSLLQTGVYTFMGSAGDSSALFKGLHHVLRGAEPALAVLFCPDPAHYRTGLWPQWQRQALAARALPFFQYDPEKAGLTRAAGISLAGNPAEEAARPYAEWLFNLNDWQGHFRETTDDNSAALILDVEGLPKKYAVTEAVTRACAAAAASWNYLREMAGALSAHPEKIWGAAEAEAEARFEARLKEVEAGYEERIRHLEQEFMEKTRVRLREKLLALAKQRGL